MNKNTSQDPDYVGPVGREKKVHKNTFSIRKPWKGTGDRWVKIREGRYKLIPKQESRSAGLGNSRG